MKNFDIDQAGMKEQLQQLFQLLTILEPELAKYLIKQESSNMFFCFRWLLVWFKREFSFDEIYILWETIWANSCPNYHLFICLAILDTEKDQIMTNEFGFTEILKVSTYILVSCFKLSNSFYSTSMNFQTKLI